MTTPKEKALNYCDNQETPENEEEEREIILKSLDIAIEETKKEFIELTAQAIKRIEESNRDKNSSKPICLGCTYGLLRRFEKELGL